MSLEIWLSRGRKIDVGGRELLMMPLPLSRLVKIGHWLEANCNDVVHEIIRGIRAGGQDVPTPLGMITQVLLRVNLSDVALEVFSIPKDENGDMINKGITKEFFDDNLDIPKAHELYEIFVELNGLPTLIKNLQSLPIVKKWMEVGALTFGIPFLSSLQPNTDSTQKPSEGSPIPKSTVTSVPATSEEPDLGNTEINQVVGKDGKRQFIQ